MTVDDAGAVGPAGTQATVLAEMTRLNNELSSRERELARSRAEVGRLLEAERRRSTLLEALHRATRAILSVDELDALLDEILASGMAAIPSVDRGFVLLGDAVGGTRTLRAARGFDAPGPDLDPYQPIIAPRDGEDEAAPRVVGLADGSSAIVGALRSPASSGALVLVAGPGRTPSGDDAELLESFSAVASLAIRNGELLAEVRTLAVTDPMTGALNRRGFYARAQQELARAARYGRPLSLVMVDADHFKRVNDTHGHDAGDRVLVAIVAACRRGMRATDAVARLGGEEFCLLLPETPSEGAVVLAGRMRAGIAALRFPVPDGEFGVTASFGVAEHVQGDTIEGLLRLADEALYRAKEEGRDRVIVAAR
jgi:diguanylate cyclase (GGDEF)-like protein